MKHEEIQDPELIDRINTTNDPYWFGILYDRHSKAVFNKCLLLLKSNSDAEDLTHDIFLKVFLSLKQFKKESQFRTWLLAITYNFCISFIRKKNQSTLVDEEKVTGHTDEEEIDDSDFLRLRIVQLEWALEEIKPEEKMILLMKYQDDLSIKNIEEVLNLSESAVKMRIKRAKNRVMELCKTNKTL